MSHGDHEEMSLSEPNLWMMLGKIQQQGKDHMAALDALRGDINGLGNRLDREVDILHKRYGGIEVRVSEHDKLLASSKASTEAHTRANERRWDRLLDFVMPVGILGLLAMFVLEKFFA